MKDILKKYDIPAPRYTSYPTVPYWDEPPTSDLWTEHLKQAFAKDEMSWSMYLHIPFCETLCTFCGCNNIITKDHKKESPYVNLLIEELCLYLEKVPQISKKEMKHIHLGGGTPTFLSTAELEKLIKNIFSLVRISEKDFEASIEVDPRRTGFEQMKMLRQYGFNRISLGVQDFDHEVQRLVNRIQPYEITKKITDEARGLGFESVNFDLIYGLAKQTAKSMERTTLQTLELKPDRIALYSFALVPWIKPAQRLFKDEDLPVGAEKRELYEIARNLLLNSGYVEIGMDHFALANERLALATKTQGLHRNFMGYTDQKTDVLLGLGVSSISESPSSFHQNEKVLPVYEQKIKAHQLATFRGHILSKDDQTYRKQILDLMTKYEVEFLDQAQENDAKKFLHEMINDKLVQVEKGILKIPLQGRPFLRNACLFFDQRLRAKQPMTTIFSSAI